MNNIFKFVSSYVSLADSINDLALDNSEYNYSIFSLLALPSEIVMHHKNGTKIENYSKLILEKDSKLTVTCDVVDTQPAATITWEYNGKNLDWKSNPTHCYEPEKNDNECVTYESRTSEKDASLTTTKSIATVTVGQKHLNKLRCLAHHPALQHRNREMHSEVTLEMEKKGKFKVQQIFKKYLGVLCVYFELMNKAVTILYIFYKNEIAVLLFQHHGFQKKLGNHP